MEKIDYKVLINQFLDGELEKKKERELFEVLAHDEECRDYFKQINMIKTVAHEDQQEFPSELEERIMYSVGTLSEKANKPGFFANKFFAFAAYGFATVLVALSVHLYTVTSNYQTELAMTKNTLNEKSKLVDMLYFNSLPAARVTDYKLNRFDYPKAKLINDNSENLLEDSENDSIDKRQ